MAAPLSFSPLPPGYGLAWDVCSLLGQCDGYGELEARQELLAFSLTHCPPDSIHGLLAASSDLQSQVGFLRLRCCGKRNARESDRLPANLCSHENLIVIGFWEVVQGIAEEMW